VLRWLTRLFRQREAAEAAPHEAASPPAPPAAAVEPTASEPTASEPVTTSESGTAEIAEPVEIPAGEIVPATSEAEQEKETCPTCGRTSVFAGPPGQRFCTYCALRDELFEKSAAASE
jgi:hypothetical protein